MALVTEDQVELQSIEWFKDLGYQYVCGYDIAVDGETPERTDYRSVVLKDRLLSAVTRINPDIPKSAIDTALSQLMNPNIPALMSCNRQVHSWLTKGVKVTIRKVTRRLGSNSRSSTSTTRRTTTGWWSISSPLVRSRTEDLRVGVSQRPPPVSNRTQELQMRMPISGQHTTSYRPTRTTSQTSST